MKYTVRPAQFRDLQRIGEIYDFARKFMAENGNPNQWGKTHPPMEQLMQDIERQCLFVVTDSGGIHGVFFFQIGADPTYGKIDGGTWRCHSPYGTIHRIAGDGSGGILKTAVEFGKQQIDHLRIDTHEDNRVMRNALAKLAFRRRGVIYLADGAPRIAFDYLMDTV